MSEQNPQATPPSPEEVEAAMAANTADEMARLPAELAELKAKSADLADQFLRAKAEAENARRRAEDEVSKARKFGVESFAESMLAVCDSLDAALDLDLPDLDALTTALGQPCAGSAQARLTLSGPAVSPRLDLKGVARRLRLGELALAEARLDAHLADSARRPDGKAALSAVREGETARAEAAYAITGTRLRLTGLKLDAPDAAFSGEADIGDEARGRRADHDAGQQVADQRRHAQAGGDETEYQRQAESGGDGGDQGEIVMHGLVSARGG